MEFCISCICRIMAWNSGGMFGGMLPV